MEARIYSLTNGKQVLLRGWYLLVTDSGEEFLMKRHATLSTRRFFPLYTSSLSMKQYIIENGTTNSSALPFSVTFLAIVTGSIVRNIIPRDVLIGPVNSPFHLMTALINLSIVVAFSLIFKYSFDNIRDFRMRRFLKKKGISLTKIGRVRAITPYRYTPDGKEYW